MAQQKGMKRAAKVAVRKRKLVAGKREATIKKLIREQFGHDHDHGHDHDQDKK